MGQVSLEARIRRRVRIVGLLLLGFFGAASRASAAPVTWNGGGDPDFNWMNAANWAGNLAPTPGTDDLHFAGSVGPTSTNNFTAGSQFGGITFDAGAAPFTLGGNPINLSGDLVNNSSNLQTVNLPLNVIGNRNINAGTAGLNLAGLSGGSGAGQVITLLGTGGAIAGPISGTTLLQQNASTGGSDSDTWSFLGNNTSNFTGQFVLSRGITNFGSATDAPNVKITPSSRDSGFRFFVIGNSAVAGSSSTFNMTAGTLTLDGGGSNPLVVLGNSTGDHAIWNQTGGTVTLQNFASNYVLLANQIGSTAQFNISGGTFDTGTLTFKASIHGSGQVNISGTGILKAPVLYLNQGSDASAVGVLNLNGGTLQLGTLESTNSAGAATINFNGGTLMVSNSVGLGLGSSPNGPITANVQAGGAIIDTSAATATVSVNIPLQHDPTAGAAPDGGLTKNGTGTLAFSDAITSSQPYTGPTTINSGTLQITNSGQLGPGPIANNGVLSVFTGSNSYATVFVTLPNTISGTGSLSVSNNNSGITTLSGANTYSGPTQVRAGTLNVTGSLSTTGTVNLSSNNNFDFPTLAGTGDGVTTGVMGNVVMAAGAKLRPGDGGADGQIGTLKMSNLTANAVDMRFDFATPANSDKLIVTGPATFSGNSVISTPALPSVGTYVLLSAGSLSGTAPKFTGPAAGTTRSDPVLQFDIVANQIRLVSAGTAKTLTWTGATNSAWDLHGSQNWSDNGGLTTNETFFDYDSVVFDDTAANRSVTLNSALHPRSVTINNSLGHDYTISGTSGIADTGYTLPTFLIKKGTGEVTLGGKNQYTGSTIVEEGTFAVGSAPTGAPTLKGSMQLGTAVSSAVLDLNGLNLGVNGGIGSGGGDAGSIIGNSSTTSSSILTINAGAPATFAGTIQDSINGGTRTVGLTIGGTWTLTGNNTYSGGTPIFGTLQLGNGGTTGMIPLSGVRVNNNLGTLIFDHSDPITLTSPIAGTGTLRQSGSGVLTILYDSTLQYHRVSAGSTLQVGNGGTTGNFVSSQGTYGPDAGGLLIFNRSDGTLATRSLLGATLPATARFAN